MKIPEWFPLVVSHPLLSAALFLFGVLALIGLRPLLHRSRIGTRLDSSLTLVCVGLVFGALSSLGRGGTDGVLYLYAYALFITAVAIGGVRIALLLFVDFYFRERKGAAVSSIFRDIATVITYFIIILLVLRLTLDINVASLITTSAVLTAIIGLALQDVLGAVISGLVIELEASFAPGDWIKVGAFEGEVLETGWRTTRIRTRVNEAITLPNTYVARESVVNYSRPDPRHGDTLYVDAAYEITPTAVKASVLAVLRADPAVLADPEPEVRTVRFKEFAIEYAIRYWIDQFRELDRIRDRVMTNLWYAFRREGIRIPFPTSEHYFPAESPQPLLVRGDTFATLTRVPLLAPLGEDHLRRLAARARRLLFGRGECVVREGEAGDSFYVIEHGRVSIVIGGRDGARGQLIAELGAGDFFGEMSLLAGDARTATVLAQTDAVVLEVNREAFHEMLVADPGVLEPISQIAAHRGEEQREHRSAVKVMPAFANDQAAQHLLVRIKAFFGL